MYKAISKHVIQRYKDRGLDVTHLYRDLHTRNLKRMITRKDGIKILYTKNKLILNAPTYFISRFTSNSKSRIY